MPRRAMRPGCSTCPTSSRASPSTIPRSGATRRRYGSGFSIFGERADLPLASAESSAIRAWSVFDPERPVQCPAVVVLEEYLVADLYEELPGDSPGFGEVRAGHWVGRGITTSVVDVPILEHPLHG